MSAAELAARRYIDAWFEPDRDRRAALLEMCFAVDGRIAVLYAFSGPLPAVQAPPGPEAQ